MAEGISWLSPCIDRGMAIALERNVQTFPTLLETIQKPKSEYKMK